MVQEDWKCDGHREDHAGGGVEDYSRMEIFTGMGARCDSENVLSYDTKSSFYRNSKTSRNEENKSRGRHGSPELRNGRLIMGKKKCGKYVEINHKCIVQGFMIVGWWCTNSDLLLPEVIYLGSLLVWSVGRKFSKYIEAYYFSVACYSFQK